ncbi:hypothetical protein HGH92_26515 [Chitinophaga varians]|uniref:Uncharacterized protein n=1 Tax=Chitinophaga varians TaxID=2202339 RepID=A0A847RYM5_9BACT|nr:hypothetical protein [Chitinophaga varians]NLR67886.1 hypothetical protein [Chitinophaga varians]
MLQNSNSYALEWFDIFITRTLPSTPTGTITADFSRNIIEESLHEKEKARIAFFNQVFQAVNEEALRLTVNRFQMAIVRLLDQLHHHPPGHKLETKVISSMQRDLKDLLEIIERSFNKYFDLDQKVPESYIAICKSDVKKKLNGLMNFFVEREQDMDLVAIVETFIKNFISENQRSHVNYREFLYMKNAWEELNNSTLYCEDNLQFPLLIDVLIRINFNGHMFVDYFVNRYSLERILAAESNEERIRVINSIRKSIRQREKIPNLKYRADLPDVIIQIDELLSDEVTTVEVKDGGDIKVQTSLPVPLLGAITRLMKDKGIIVNDNVTKLLEFISLNFTTTKTANISYTHLHSSYYSIDRRIKERLYDILMDLAKKCRSY